MGGPRRESALHIASRRWAAGMVTIRGSPTSGSRVPRRPAWIRYREAIHGRILPSPGTAHGRSGTRLIRSASGAHRGATGSSHPPPAHGEQLTVPCRPASGAQPSAPCVPRRTGTRCCRPPGRRPQLGTGRSHGSTGWCTRSHRLDRGNAVPTMARFGLLPSLPERPLRAHPGSVVLLTVALGFAAGSGGALRVVRQQRAGRKHSG